MRFSFVFLIPVVLSGCINITTELQPSNADVKAVLLGEDCTPIILGMGPVQIPLSMRRETEGGWER